MSDLPKTDSKTLLILRGSIIWRIIFAIFSAGSIFVIWAGYLPETPLWQKILLTLFLGLASIFSGIAAFDISKRRHRGRVISLSIDYLAFVASFVVVLNTGEVFIGIDAFAETFGKGIPYLGIALAGYLVSVFSERFSKNAALQARLSEISRYAIFAGAVLFLWKVDALKGIIYFFTKLNTPRIYCRHSVIPFWHSNLGNLA